MNDFTNDIELAAKDSPPTANLSPKTSTFRL